MSEQLAMGAGQRPGPAYLDPKTDAMRESYDRVATDYADLLRPLMARQPFDRAMLATFAEFVRADGVRGPVADLGCGPGRVTAHLHDLGLDVFGVDLSPGMVAVARRDHPHLRFEVGSIQSLDVGDGALAGVVAWYSIIHTPTTLLPQVFAEFRRVLAPGGPLLLAFQAEAPGGTDERMHDECVHLEQAYGHAVSIDAYRRSPDVVAGLLGPAGFTVFARLVREPDVQEKNRQAYMMAR